VATEARFPIFDPNFGLHDTRRVSERAKRCPNSLNIMKTVSNLAGDELMKVEIDSRELDFRWYAAYTRSRHEKRVLDRLQAMSIECFLPLCNTLSRWKDRNMFVQLPLFPGYLFVRIGFQQDWLRVLQSPGVVRFVGQSHRPEPLPEGDIDALRNAVSQNVRVEPHPFLKSGERVLIANGPFEGMEGVLLRKNRLRVVLSLTQIHSSFVLDVDACDVYPVTLMPTKAEGRPKSAVATHSSLRTNLTAVS
jgi:transcription antitermination factor NusG